MMMIGHQRIAFLVLILLASLPTAVASGSGNILRLRDEVEIMTRTYTLGEIADLNGLTDALKERLAALVIGKTPRPGQWTQKNQVEVSAALEKAVSGVTHRFRWQGPAYIRIRGGGVLCDVEALRQTAYRLILDRLQTRYEGVTVNFVGDTKPLITPAGRISFHPKMSPARHLQKRMPVWVDVFVDDGHFQTMPIWFDVSVAMPVWVVRKEIYRRESVTDMDVEKKVKDIAALGGQPLMVQALEALRASRYLAEGRILTVADVEPVPAVSKGDLITVLARHGMIQLQVKAVALTDGKVSQMIDVENPGSGKSFRAKVIGTKKAMVN